MEKMKVEKVKTFSVNFIDAKLESPYALNLPKGDLSCTVSITKILFFFFLISVEV
jgi:hypothetical protein